MLQACVSFPAGLAGREVDVSSAELGVEQGGRIVVLGTGGTIAGRAQRPDELLAYRAGEVPVDELLRGIPLRPQAWASRPSRWRSSTARTWGRPSGACCRSGCAITWAGPRCAAS